MASPRCRWLFAIVPLSFFLWCFGGRSFISSNLMSLQPARQLRREENWYRDLQIQQFSSFHLSTVPEKLVNGESKTNSLERFWWYRRPIESFKIAFYHQPKTGGTTLRSVLHAYGVAYNLTTCPYVQLAIFRKRSNQPLESFDVVYGHYPLSFLLHLKEEAGHKLITLIRDPIDRLISQFLYTNTRSKLLPGAFRSFVRGKHAKSACQLLHIRSVDQIPDVLNQFDVTGTTDRFNEFLLLMNQKLKFPSIIYTKKKVLEGRPTVKNLSLEVQELIKETYTCDFVLYDAVVQQMRGELLAHFKTEKALQSALDDYESVLPTTECEDDEPGVGKFKCGQSRMGWKRSFDRNPRMFE